uniref:Dynamin_M domain-containing protein n=1 Tax=Heterorhabditis bacteriophora TaxID=37862 RepID=A0A1I7WYU8_HETBA
MLLYLAQLVMWIRDLTATLCKVYERVITNMIYRCSKTCKLCFSLFFFPVDDKSRTLLQIITRFATAYTSTIDGTSRNIETTEFMHTFNYLYFHFRCGGARICYIFHETFGRSLESVNPLENLTQMDILTAIRNATVCGNQFYIQHILIGSIQLLQSGMWEMQRMVKHCGLTTQRFPRLYDKINEVVSGVLKERLRPTNEMVNRVCYLSCCFFKLSVLPYVYVRCNFIGNL